MKMERLVTKMTLPKLMIIVKGYLWKDKKGTVLSSLFLCCVTIFLLTGNQLFVNMQAADQRNAQALEGRQHASYFDLSQEEFLKIKSCSFVAQAGRIVSLGHSEDGTDFAYIDEDFRDLGATVARKNIKKLIRGHWPENKENKQEAVFTENFMQKHGLETGDSITVNLTADDPDTGDLLFHKNGLTLTAVGIIEPETGFTDRMAGYVSQSLADEMIRQYGLRVNVVVRFDRPENITQYFDQLNARLGYTGDSADALHARKNLMLVSAADNSGTLKNQNRMMNFALWLISVLVVYHIFYNRLFEKKKDFTTLLKIGFHSRDLFKIASMEFLILACIGMATGIFAGYFVNRAVYSRVLDAWINTYDAGSYVSADLSFRSIKNTAILLMLISMPVIASALLQLRSAVPVSIMRGRRKNVRKVILSLMIVSLSAILISILGIQDNQSDAGILYVKEYVPGDMQVTTGGISENIFGGSIPSISDQAYEEIRTNPQIHQVQDYQVNYDNSLFLCAKKQDLNPDGGFYESSLEMEQDIDGKKQCLYNLIPVTTDNLQALVPSYDEAEDGHAVILDEELAKTFHLEIGDTFTLYDEQLIENGSKNGSRCVRVKLLDTRRIILSENHLGSNLILTDPETARLFPGELHRQVVNVWTSGNNSRESDIEYIAQTYGYSFHSARRQIQKYAQSDQSQKTMRFFFIAVLALTGLITYFNTVFTNLLDQRKDFAILHKIGIGRREIYQMTLKNGIRQGTAAAAATGIVQAGLCMGGTGRFCMLFALTDAGIVLAGVVFPMMILWMQSKTAMW